MAAKRPIFTENFSTNLSAIEVFLGSEGHTAFQQFLDHLFNETIPLLCRFPESGRAFLRRAIKSSKAEALSKELRRLLKKGDNLREIITDDYLLLYLVRYDRIIFLTVKHHRQLSFDLKQFWQSG
jgi:ParE toxin of type II toxin-antitoxin system, parDE